MTSRRSFLAAIAGAVAGRKALAEPSQHGRLALQQFDELWAELKTACERPIKSWHPFWVWENVELQGKAGELRILPPPLPPEMLISEAGVYMPPEVRVQTVQDICERWELRMTQNGKALVVGRLMYFAHGIGYAMPFAKAFHVHSSDDLAIELKGEDFQTEQPVHIQVVMKGVIPV